MPRVLADDWKSKNFKRESMNMSQSKNLDVAKSILGDIASGKDPKAIALAFAEDLVFHIQGDTGVFPWIGTLHGRNSVAEFLTLRNEFVEQMKFDVDDVMASEARAIVLGTLASKVKRTGKVIESTYAIIFTITDGFVTRFEMLEDSFAVSRAAR
jgi:ketosteroid isomerase-like protein